MASAAPQAPPGPRVRQHAERFWFRVSEGLEVNQLWSQFEKEARSSYRFYSAGVVSQAEGKKGLSRVAFIAKTLFWAILEKLSPARRVLLLVGLILLAIPWTSASFNQGGQLRVVEFDLRLWGGLLVFFVLLLELADRVTMKRDLEIAKEIQSWLLPGAPLQMPGYQIAYATRPANTVAGDYYDVILRPGENAEEDRVLFVVADVAGKSIPAAMLMATFQASLRTLSSARTSLVDIVAGLNRYSCSNSQGGARFTTAFLAQLDPATGEVEYVNAGHNAPMVRRASGELAQLNAGGIPLGILEAATYEMGRTTLEHGEWMVIFTDGVVEAVNVPGEEYGEENLIKVIHAAASASPAQMLRQLLADMDGFVGNTPQHDDMTCLLVKRLPG